MAKRLWKRCDASSTEGLWCDTCGSALAPRLRKRYDLGKRYDASSGEALWLVAMTRRSVATPTEALWRYACAIWLRKR